MSKEITVNSIMTELYNHFTDGTKWDKAKRQLEALIESKCKEQREICAGSEDESYIHYTDILNAPSPNQ